MTRICYDIEADNLYPSVTKLHCIATVDVDTGEEALFCDEDPAADGSLEAGLDYLYTADLLIGHNIVGYDNRVLYKLRKWKPREGCKSYDTLVAGMLLYPDLKYLDFTRRKAQIKKGTQVFPGNQIGHHSLEAWGHRLGIHKAQKPVDWSTYTPDMGQYCLQDVLTNVALFHRMMREWRPVGPLANEQEAHRILTIQEETGFPLDLQKVDGLIEEMQKDYAVLSDDLLTLFPPKKVIYYTPKKKLRREKEIPFNPNSRLQIGERLIEKYGWEPKDYTDGGRPKVDEKVLGNLPYPEAQKFADYLLLGKRIGQVATGNKSWLNLVSDEGRLHGRVKVIGTPHGRCAHIDPNLAQIPSVAKKYGKECREAFVPSPGRVQVGWDASGIQLRALAHFLARYDGGAYVKTVTEGDPHTANQKAAGLETRHSAKTFIYSFLFGAGDAHIGIQLGADPTKPQAARKVGRQIRNRFLKRTVGLSQLLEDLEAAWKERGYLLGLDGRVVPIPSKHVLLNYLLTAFEVATMKWAMVYVERFMNRLGLADRYAQLAFVHDELQYEADPEIAETLGKVGRRAIIAAGRHYNSRCPLDGEYKIGSNWYECH